MNTLPDVQTGELAVLLGPRAARETMLALTAVLALRGPVQVLDAGNCFNAYQVARQLRRHTTDLDAALNRITIARAFTCYQVVALFQQTQATAAPLLVFDLLATFTDESVAVPECYRLLRQTTDHLRRLRRCAPVVVSLRPPRQPDRQGLVTAVTQLANHLLEEYPSRHRNECKR